MSMMLIGQYDSPFVRRVAITLRWYGLEYEHRPWSVWGDAEKIALYNPLRRVPTLVIDGGLALQDSAAIIDTLDELAGEERALLPRSGPVRREGLRLVALSTGLADKAVSLLYEKLFRAEPSQLWLGRCALQIMDTLALLEADRTARATPFWLGESLSHVDVAFACAFRFAREAHPTLFATSSYPALEAEAARCEALEHFSRVVQPILNEV